MAIGHRHRGMGMGTHILEKLLKDREVTNRLYQGHEINREYDIPYLGGYSVDGKTIYFDRHLPDRITFEVDGKKYDFDPIRFVKCHEAFEKAVMDALGWTYTAAHEAATGYERRQVLAAGLPWQEYQNSLKKYIKTDESEPLEKIPSNLDMQPYYTEPVDKGLITRMEKAMVDGKEPAKHTKQEVNYSKGKPSAHCGICEHFEPPHGCCLVKGYIQKQQWCVLFEERDAD